RLRHPPVPRRRPVTTPSTAPDPVTGGPGPGRADQRDAGSMSVALEGLRTVIYPAAELDAAKGWWTALLGSGPYFDQPFYVGFDIGGFELGLLPDADPADGALVYWGTTDVAAAVAAAVAQGATEHAPVTEVGDGIVTATVRNPQGMIVGFIHNPHFGAP